MASNGIETSAGRGDPDPSSEKSILRQLQRNLILGELDVHQTELIQKLFPNDKLLRYNFAFKPTDQVTDEVSKDDIYLDDLLLLFSPFGFNEQEGGYPLLFRLACTAQTPHELYNLFHGIKTLEQLEGSEYRIQYENISSSRNVFRYQGKTVQRTNLSKEAQWVYSEMEQVIGHSRGAPTLQMEIVGKEFFNPDNKSFETYKHTLAEVYLYLTLSGDFDNYWNELFLYGTRFFKFGEERVGKNKLDIFSEEATFWKQVNGSWIGIKTPDDLKFPLSDDIQERDRELSRLRIEKAGWFYARSELERRILDLEFSLKNERDTSSRLIQERDQLKTLLEAFEKRQGGTAWISSEPTYTTRDAVDNFLATFHLTRDTIAEMTDVVRRREIVAKLKRLAALSFHPNNGLSPDERKLQLINGFLSKYDPSRDLK